MAFWLMKSEPDEFGIDDLAAALRKTTAWFGVRNYQARNFMLKQMQIGDKVFFYHSSCPEPGIAGIAQVSSAAYPDASQRSEEHTSELQSLAYLVCRLLLEKKKKTHSKTL